MTHIKANSDVQGFLRQVQERAFIYDENGAFLGVFVPESEAKEEFLEWTKSIFGFDEIQRRKATEQGASTTKEVLEHLQALETNKK